MRHSKTNNFFARNIGAFQQNHCQPRPSQSRANYGACLLETGIRTFIISCVMYFFHSDQLLQPWRHTSAISPERVPVPGWGGQTLLFAGAEQYERRPQVKFGSRVVAKATKYLICYCHFSPSFVTAICRRPVHMSDLLGKSHKTEGMVMGGGTNKKAWNSNNSENTVLTLDAVKRTWSYNAVEKCGSKIWRNPSMRKNVANPFTVVTDALWCKLQMASRCTG